DGAIPSNKDRGYVIRSVLRRALRFGWQRFGIEEPFLYKLVPELVNQMGGAFPELRENPARVQQVIQGEEMDFLRTIERGLIHFSHAVRRAKKLTELTKANTEQYLVIHGKDVFDLHTTYGFPPDLTQQMAEEQGLIVAWDEYERYMREHGDKSR